MNEDHRSPPGNMIAPEIPDLPDAVEDGWGSDPMRGDRLPDLASIV